MGKTKKTYEELEQIIDNLRKECGRQQDEIDNLRADIFYMQIKIDKLEDERDSFYDEDDWFPYDSLDDGDDDGDWDDDDDDWDDYSPRPRFYELDDDYCGPEDLYVREE